MSNDPRGKADLNCGYHYDRFAIEERLAIAKAAAD